MNPKTQEKYTHFFNVPQPFHCNKNPSKVYSCQNVDFYVTPFLKNYQQIATIAYS
jgi:hypothetical protein